MSQVALNTVALFMFAMTCLILLGPLLHISPGVPVVLILAGLTVGTGDMFAFQGRGANLFLDFFAQRSPEYRDRIVHHEAGHFLMAHLLGVPIQDYTLTAIEAMKAGYAGIGGVQLELIPLTQTKLEQVKAYGAIAMAGRAAEKIAFDKIEGGKDDLRWFQQQLNALNLNAQIYEQEANLKAQRLLKENWEGYLALVESMKNRDSVEACKSVIASHTPVSEIA